MKRNSLLAALLLTATTLMAQEPSLNTQHPTPNTQEPIDYVDPFIGTTNFSVCNPGAVLPQGMMSVVPFNVMGSDLNANDKDSRWWSAPYEYHNKFFTGFAHVTLSGVGCPEMGSLLTMPTAGKLDVDYRHYGSEYQDEQASPGYYAVSLKKYGIRCEVTSTLRSSAERYTFPKGEGHILLNVGDALSNEVGGMVRRVSSTEIEGFRLLGTFCYNSQAVFPIYFVMRVNKAPKTSGYWKKQPPMTGPEAAWDADNGKYKLYTRYGRELAGNEVGYFFSYDCQEGEQVEVQMGVSFVSIDNARENLNTEQPSFAFEQIKRNAREQWRKCLDKVTVEGGTDRDKRMFYTALYHTQLHPNILNDVNGEYPRMEEAAPLSAPEGKAPPSAPEGATNEAPPSAPEGATNVFALSSNEAPSGAVGGAFPSGAVGGASGASSSPSPRYTVFSLWDTYRNVSQLMTLLYPDKQLGMVRSMIDMYKEWGWMPKWELYGRETWTMEGDPSIPVIADTWLKGLRDFDIETAYEAFLKSATLPSKDNLMRPDNDPYLERGYVPMGFYAADMSGDNSVSHALEYYIADYALSQLASSLGEKADAKRFYSQSLGYRNYYSKEYGTLRPRQMDGSFLTPFDPKAGADFSNAPGFHEGSAWNYTFYVPHDIPGLARLMGGRKKFVEKLQMVFDQGLYDPANEPDIAYPYLFNYFPGEEWRTQKIVSDLISRHYSDKPDGIPGNDDCGTMSAWLIFSMMGIYPDCPGSPYYSITTPVFDRVTLHLDPRYYPNGDIVIEKTGSATGSIKGISLQGKPFNRFRITHDQLVNGKTLQLQLR